MKEELAAQLLACGSFSARWSQTRDALCKAEEEIESLRQRLVAKEGALSKDAGSEGHDKHAKRPRVG